MDQSEPQSHVQPSVERVSANARVVPEEKPFEARAADWPGRSTFRGDLLNVVRGFCMGAADTVPGISGGTIALIMGHYSRLVTAISHLDGTLLGLLSKREFRRGGRACRLSFSPRVGLRHPGRDRHPLGADALLARCPSTRNTRRLSRTVGGELVGGGSVRRSMVAVADRRLRSPVWWSQR